MTSLAELKNHIMRLPEEDRETLAYDLFDSLPAPGQSNPGKSDQHKLKSLQYEVLKGIQAGNRGEHITQTLDEIAIEEQTEYEAKIG